jgi:hypothetical protein
MPGGAPGSGATLGNRSAWKHGRYSTESITLRRHIRDLLRSAHELVEKI